MASESDDITIGPNEMRMIAGSCYRMVVVFLAREMSCWLLE